MKTKAIFTLVFSFIGYLGFANVPVSEDTVVIKFGNNSKIVIYVNNSDDLKALEAYDINQIVKDLNLSLDSAENEKYLVIEDESGKKYLKDTTIEVREDDDDDDDDRAYKWDRDEDDDDDDYFAERRRYRWDDDDDDDDDYRRYNYGIKRTRNSLNFDLGSSNWFEGGNFPNDELYAVKPWASWYIAINSIQKTNIDGPLFLEWGPGVSWYNWKFEDRSVRVSKGDTQVEFSQALEVPDVNFKMSKLATSYLNFSLVPMLDFSYGKKEVERRGEIRKYTSKKRNGIRIGAGAYAGIRLGGRAVFINKEDGDKDKNKDKGDFYLENFRYGIRGQIGYKGIDFFANYDLNNVFTSGNGPKLNGFSFGLIL